MGSYSEEPEFKTLTIHKLHPTFAAEVEGVNFQNLSDEQFQEIFAAMATVRCPLFPELFAFALPCLGGFNATVS